jgi:hypothetical protein
MKQLKNMGSSESMYLFVEEVVGRVLLVEVVVEHVLYLEKKDKRLPHPHTGEVVGAGPTSLVGVTHKDVQPLQLVAQQYDVLPDLQL